MTESLKDRDGAIINHWYIACLSNELKTKPLQVILYDKAYVLFRSSLGVTCLPDRCLHRGALLSEGEVRNNHLACPYHGWEYDQNGRVERIPSENPDYALNREICSVKVPSFEREGVIWIWTGDQKIESTEPPWHFPYFTEKGWHNYFMVTDFENEVTNLCENFMDVPHTVYVHQGWFRDEQKERTKIPMTVETKEAQVMVTYHQQKDEFSLGAKLLLNPKGLPMKHTDQFIFPNLTKVDYWFGEENGFIINSQCTPVSTMKSRVYTYIAYKVPLLGALVKPYVRFYTRQVINQDVKIMLNQKKSFDFDSKMTFRSTDVDEVHVAIERLRHFGKMKDPKLSNFVDKKEIFFWI
ncbi:MAG: Rieske 2Fe-2S domain-containing protein [Bacteriovoracaceae bacterium]